MTPQERLAAIIWLYGQILLLYWERIILTCRHYKNMTRLNFMIFLLRVRLWLAKGKTLT